MLHWPRPGHVLTIPAIALATGLAAWLALHAASVRNTSTVPISNEVTTAPLMSMRPDWAGGAQFEAPSLESMLRRISLDPSALTAAGVTTQQGVATVVGAVRTHLAEHGVAFSIAESDWFAARVECESLERLARSGRASQEDLTNLASAQSQRASSRSAFETALEGFFAAGVDGMAPEVVNRLIAIRAHRATELGELPVQHLVESRTDAELVAVREALAEERMCAKWSEAPTQATATRLANE